MHKYYDLHMHFDLYKDKDEVLKYIEANKYYTLGMTNLPILYENYAATLEEYKYFKLALGYHPELVNKYQDQLPIFFRNINRTRYIGEIGLDFSKKYDESNKQLQRKIFSAILDKSSEVGGKILSIHSRRAVDEVSSMIAGHNGKIILHWFTGTTNQLEKMDKENIYYSINQSMIVNRSSRELLKYIPIKQILLESDAPFTIGLKEEYNFGFCNKIIEEIANIKRIEKKEVENSLFDNFKLLIK